MVTKRGTDKLETENVVWANLDSTVPPLDMPFVEHLREMANPKSFTEAYQQLSQSGMRSRAAVCLTVQESELINTKTADDVEIGTRKYAVGFGLQRNKREQFREAIGDGSSDWAWMSGTKGVSARRVPHCSIEFLQDEN